MVLVQGASAIYAFRYGAFNPAPLFYKHSSLRLIVVATAS